MKIFLLVLVLAFAFFPAAALAQKVSEPEQNPKTTQAYSMLIQQKVKLQAELENLLSEYTSDWPKSKKVQFELDTLKSEMKKMAEVEESKVSKLTPVSEVWFYAESFWPPKYTCFRKKRGSDWPPLKQKQRELELLDKEIQKLMR